ncbi:MAG: serine protease [Candidatus Bathyarchaeota archaeon]|nr:serine protease [Candidatus Bathyarchaeota archaeon]
MKKLVESFKQNVVRIDVSIRGKQGNGSGVIVDKEGTVLTCEHVVRPDGLEPEDINVVKDGKEYSPKIIRLDRNRDIAVLNVKELSGICSFKKYDDVKVGDRCIVMGYPLRIGHLTVLEATVSAKGEYLVSGFPYELLQIDSRVNQGNSGGPVIDIETGRIVGVVSLKYIPFLASVKELQEYIERVPIAPSGVASLSGIDIGLFFNYVNESIRRLSKALMLVQVGIGWVIPSDLLLQHLQF